ncbi:hypothetical protein CL630_02635 [bacterium]|nr:hypothetical protein [bacterium]|tara:strand:- start:8306 stop:9073 length:768 start_codon:yes stop_codon:yes gene_type:complete
MDEGIQHFPLKNGSIKQSMTKAIICAAGRGNRLSRYTEEYPKALLPIGKKQVIKHILETLFSSGITDVIIVVGYMKEAVISCIGKEYKGCSITYVSNDDFDFSDNLYSMWLARDHVVNGMLFVNGDTVFHMDILKNFLAHKIENAVVVDTVNKEDNPVSAHISDGCVMEIGHDIENQSHGDVFGIYKLSQTASERYFSIADKIFTQGPQKGGFFIPLQQMVPEIKIEPFFSDDSRWVNINNEKDYKRAQHLFGNL